MDWRLTFIVEALSLIDIIKGLSVLSLQSQI